MKITSLNLGEYKPYLAAPGVGLWKYEKTLPLTTDGHLRVIALGVGSAFANKNFQSNFIIVKGNDVLWIDLGTKTPIKLVELGLSVHDIKNLFISHLHSDHVGGVEEWALKRRYQAMYILPRQEGEEQPSWVQRALDFQRSGKFRHHLHAPHDFSKQIWDMTLRGGLAHSEEIDLNGVAGEMQPAHYYNVVPLTDKTREFGIDCYTFHVGSIKVKAFRVAHVPDNTSDLEKSFFSVGFVIDDRCYISGDTKFDSNPVLNFGRNCETIFHDCQSFPGGVHASYKELQTLPVEIKAKTYLYHLDDGMLFKPESLIQGDGFAGFMRPVPDVYDFID